MRVNKLDIGLEAISRWRESDEVYLPTETSLAPAFVPVRSLLDEILFRPDLDERLVGLMQPQRLDQGLLEAAVLSQIRREVSEFFADAAGAGHGHPVLAAAAELLAAGVELDEAVSTALAVLIRG
jgi:hypothetical protein